MAVKQKGMVIDMKKSKKTIKRTLCLILSASMSLTLAGCGKEETSPSAITDKNQEIILEQVLGAQVNPSHSSKAGKEETVYVLADAKGGVNQVIVSDWLKNSGGGQNLTDCSDLTGIRNIKGYETYEMDEKGNIIWNAQGSDIYYQGTTNKELPVKVQISYQLDGKEIAPEELAGKSGRVTIRMDYENSETRKVDIGGKEQEIKVPFAMISGMILPQDTFSNIEVTNARLLSEGNNSVIIGVAFPGLKESIDAEGLKEKLKDKQDDKEGIGNPDELKIPDYIEITADTENFQLGMTMTVAMSDILSDIELTDSFDLSSLNDSMDDLQDASNQLKDGGTELKDGTLKLKDGSSELLSGTQELWDGTVKLKDGTRELSDKSGDLDEGARKLDEGALALYEGTTSLKDGVQKLTSGTNALQDGSQKLAEGTGSLAVGAKNLNDGAHLVKDGVNQVAVQMNTLKAGIGTPVSSPAEFDPSNPTTLLQVSYLLNQSMKAVSQSEGLSEAYYNGILAKLEQQTAQAQADLDAAQANLASAKGQADSARSCLVQACQADTREVEVVTGTHMEEESHEVTVDAPVYMTTKVITESIVSSEEEESEDIVEQSTDENTETYTQSYTETVTTQTEVVDTETISVQSVDVDNIRQSVDAYQSALEDVALYEAQVQAYEMKVSSLRDDLAAAEAFKQQQEALVQKWGTSIYLGAVMEQKLSEISGQLNSQESAGGMAALVKGAGDLADGTQTALAGAAELNSGANELKKGIDTLSDGADELADGADSLNDGAATLKNGTGELKDGTGKLVEGVTTLNDGAGELKDGADALKEGVLTLDEGVGDLDEGALALVDGIFQFDEEGISKLTDLFGDDVQDVVDRLEAVSNAGKEYNTFTRLPENVDGSVRFIIKTEAVKSETP